MEHWYNVVNIWAPIATILLTIFGFTFIWLQIKYTREQARAATAQTRLFSQQLELQQREQTVSYPNGPVRTPIFDFHVAVRGRTPHVIEYNKVFFTNLGEVNTVNIKVHALFGEEFPTQTIYTTNVMSPNSQIPLSCAVPTEKFELMAELGTQDRDTFIQQWNVEGHVVRFTTMPTKIVD